MADPRIAQAEADLEAKYAHQDVQIEEYPHGGGRLWMTDKQLERAALRLTMKTRVSGGDYRNGRSDPGTDAALVADEYLLLTRRNRDAHDLIHRAADLVRPIPLGPHDAENLKAADEVGDVHSSLWTVSMSADALSTMIAGYKVARAQMGRLQPERPAVDLTKLKMHPSIQLASGAYYDFLDPASTPLSIEDMAAGLSRICRYTGQLALDEDDVYTVAQHSVLASENCGDDCDAREALLHDRFESVGNDMASPLKQLLLDYKEIEDRCEAELARQYDVPHPMSEACKRIDLRMLATEKRDLMPNNVGDSKWALIEHVTPLPFVIEPWRPSEARHRFLHRYHFLTIGSLPAPSDPYSRPHPNAPESWIEALRNAWGANPFEVGNPGR